MTRLPLIEKRVLRGIGWETYILKGMFKVVKTRTAID